MATASEFLPSSVRAQIETKFTAEGTVNSWDLNIYDTIGFTKPTQIPSTKKICHI